MLTGMTAQTTRSAKIALAYADLLDGKLICGVIDYALD